MTTHRLGHVFGFGNTSPKLKRGIAILFGVAYRNNLYIIELQHGDRHMMASIVKHSGHAQFTGDNAATHNSGPLPKA